MKKLTATETEKALGLSSGSWSRCERSSKMAGLSVARKIAEYFGVSLDELVKTSVDKPRIIVMRLKRAEQSLSPREFAKAQLIENKLWNLITIDDQARRTKNMQLIDTMTDLLYEMGGSEDLKPKDVFLEES